MSNDDDTVPATASEVAATLQDGGIDALVELAKTLQEKTWTGVRRVDARYDLRAAADKYRRPVHAAAARVMAARP